MVLQLGAVSTFRRVSEKACGSWLETFNFSRVQKVTLDTAACGLEGPTKPSAGCCFPVSWLVGVKPLISSVQKVTLDTAACGLEGPIKPSAGWCFFGFRGVSEKGPVVLGWLA